MYLFYFIIQVLYIEEHFICTNGLMFYYILFIQGMRKLSKIYLAIIISCTIFLLINKIQNIDWSDEPDISIVEKRILDDTMKCLIDEFYFIQGEYQEFKDKWDHYSEVTAVSGFT